jgi:microsomal dipeptidase-like Zn-dependent dipeptidase
MIIDVDHMSEISFSDAMNIVKPRGYPVVSSHTGFTALNKGDQHNEGQRTPQQMTDILQVGGMFAVIPHQGKLDEVGAYTPQNAQQPRISHVCGNSSETFTHAYLYAVEKTGYGPVGFGTDFNAMGGVPGARHGKEACPGGTNLDVLTYQGVTTVVGYGPTQTRPALLNYNVPISVAGRQIPITKSVIGNKTFDFNEEGLAHIGMLPDLIADMQALGVRAPQLEPLFNSAEGYIRVWERAHYSSGQ